MNVAFCTLISWIREGENKAVLFCAHVTQMGELERGVTCLQAQV
jgi:hypothetical protein